MSFISKGKVKSDVKWKVPITEEAGISHNVVKE